MDCGEFTHKDDEMRLCTVAIFLCLATFAVGGVATEACKWLFENYSGRYWMEAVKKDSKAIVFWVNLIAKHGNIISINEVDSKLVEFEFEAKIGK